MLLLPDWSTVRHFPLTGQVKGKKLYVNPTPLAHAIAQFAYRPGRALLVVGEVGLVRGRPVLTQLYLGPVASNAAPIDSADLRDISIPALIAETQTVLASTSDDLRARWPNAASLATAASRRAGPGRLRGGYPAGHYRRVALLAIQLQRSGERGILTKLATQEGVPVETIRNWLRRARDLGFLPQKGTRGRAAFVPGPNLYDKEQ